MALEGREAKASQEEVNAATKCRPTSEVPKPVVRCAKGEMVSEVVAAAAAAAGGEDKLKREVEAGVEEEVEGEVTAKAEAKAKLETKTRRMILWKLDH